MISLGRRTRAGEPPVALAAGAAALALGGGGSLAALAASRPAARASRPARPQAERALFASAALLALSVLADSAMEHYRGSFKNPGMVTPLITSTVTLGRALADASGSAGRGGAAVYAGGAAVGLAGLGFHLFNITKRPGKLSWANLFYAAPIGAPAALSLSGLLGLIGLAVRRRSGGQVLGLPSGRVAAALASAGLLGTAGEAALLHFRGAFQDPFMVLPVTIPPIGAALLAKAALERDAPAKRGFSRAWLGLTTALGFIGVGFHAFGVSRKMGGWRNWTQNLFDGPPLPAPPAFAALAIAGFGALRLRDLEGAGA